MKLPALRRLAAPLGALRLRARIALGVLVLTALGAGGLAFGLSRGAQCLKGDCRDGFGTARLGDGSLYAGSFRAGRRHGYGLVRRASRGPVHQESTYFGGWKDDLPSGRGTLVRGGTRHSGFFAGGKPNGLGAFTWPDGTVLFGPFKAGEPDGPGRLMLPDGRALSGLYKDGVIREGQGVQVEPDGRRYTGSFHGGLRHGHGTLTDDHGTPLASGLWRAGKLVRADPPGPSGLR